MKQDTRVIHFQRFDLLRFLAIILIIIFHTLMVAPVSYDLSSIMVIVQHGYTAVSLFFVLSGFSLTYTFLSHSHQKFIYKRFLLSRIIRIFPVFIVIFTIAASIYRTTIKPDFLLGIFLLPIDFETYGAIPILSSFWVLSLLMKFYIIFPLLFNKSEKTISYLLYAIGITIIIKTLVFYACNLATTDILYYSIIARFDQFLFGMIAAFISYRINFKRITSGIAIVSSLGLLFLLFYCINYFKQFGAILDFFTIYRETIEGIAWALFLFGIITIKPISSIHYTWMHYLGKITYSMFMWHMLVTNAYYNIIKFHTDTLYSIPVFFINAGVILFITIIVSLLSYIVIEAPLNQFKQSYFLKEN